MTLPDFLIIGAMKCGTSTLASQLASQTGVFLTTPKEPNFFSDDDIYQNGLAWYQDLFSEAKPGQIKGEASTHYTKRPTHPDTVERMRAVLEAPRLVYMIRHPVERAISHYIHEWSEGRAPDNIEAAFRDHPEYVDYGRYAWQIDPFIDAFGRQSLCCISLEQMKAEPQKTLELVGRHIGMTTRPTWQPDLARQNVSSARIRKFPLHSLLIDNPVSASLRRTLVPRSLRDKVKATRQMKKRPSLPPDMIEELRMRLAPELQIIKKNWPDAVAAIDLETQL